MKFQKDPVERSFSWFVTGQEAPAGPEGHCWLLRGLLDVLHVPPADILRIRHVGLEFRIDRQCVYDFGEVAARAD